MSAPAADIDLNALIRDIPDFPKPGIVFKDITPLVGSPEGLKAAIDGLVARFEGVEFDAIVGVESRGFIFGAAMAYRLGKGFIPVRKPGKLPYHTERIDYSLEYGAGSLEIHADACAAGSRVIIIDDLLATGGTVVGTRQLLERLGATVAGVGFVVELGFLDGRSKLPGLNVQSLLCY